ncbi:MAG: hypothetical protein JXA99_16260 [Candidatus Lokiarchaeota archaeon]|nr:hypothetical protein [Candidatus Lokiarchaeota archaeon]
MSNNSSNLSQLLQQYPWLPSLKDIYRDIALKDPIQFINDIFDNEQYDPIIERISKFFSVAFENLEIFPPFKPDENNISFYLLLKIILFVLNNKRITNRIANLYSKVTYSEIKKELEGNNRRNGIFILYQICINLGLNIQYIEEETYHTTLIRDNKKELKTNFKLYFTDFLHLSSNLKDDYRKLVNNTLSKGYVYIIPKELTRLIQEYVRKKILEINQIDKDNIENMRKSLFNNQNFKSLYDNIYSLWELKKEDFEYSIQVRFEKDKNLMELFPPCVKETLILIKEGQNIPHISRLFLTFFLLALDYPVDNIIEIFSATPDFNKQIAQYQVEFAKKKEYSPHSCDTLKSLNLCMATKYKDKLCIEGYFSKKKEQEQKIKHPLFYTQLKQYKLSKGQND